MTSAVRPPARAQSLFDRAVSESVAPAAANSAAQAAPMPSEAPVMSTTLPSMRMEFGSVCCDRRLKRHNSTMSSRLLPLFPLQVVVFPRTPLPLHIFEERYKEMVGDAMRDNSEFGIVLAKEDGIVNAGCTVKVEKVLEMYPDGRMDILTRGQRRFEIVSLNEEKDYLQAEVSTSTTTILTPAPPELRDQALSNYQALSRIGTRATATANPTCTTRSSAFNWRRRCPTWIF